MKIVIASGLVAMFLAASAPAMAQADVPGMRMHRVQAGTIDSTGWTRANSTEGHFSVDLPCQFNDFTVDGQEADKPTKLFMVGCQRADNVRFSAIRIAYKDSAESQRQFDGFPGSAFPGATGRRSIWKGFPAVEAFISPTGKCAWVRALRVGNDVVMLMVEPIQVACTDLQSTATKFFDSIEIESK